MANLVGVRRTLLTPSQGVGDQSEMFKVQVPYGAAYNAMIGPVLLRKVTALASFQMALFDSSGYNSAGIVDPVPYLNLTAGDVVAFDPPEEFINGTYAVLWGMSIASLPDGTELITNGAFPFNVSGWTPQLTGASVTWSSGKLRLQAASGQSARATQTISGLTVGQTYRIRGKYTAIAASALMRVTTSSDGSSTGQIIVTDTATVGTSQDIATIFTASATSVTIGLLVTFEGIAEFDDISVDTLGPVVELEVAA